MYIFPKYTWLDLQEICEAFVHLRCHPESNAQNKPRKNDELMGDFGGGCAAGVDQPWLPQKGKHRTLIEPL